MMDNVRSAMARMASIQTTIHGRAATNSAASRQASADELRSAFSNALASAQPLMNQMTPTTFGGMVGSGGMYPTWGTTGPLTPAAGTRRAGAPPGFEQFDNGQLPTTMLAPIAGTDERMWAPAAAAFDHLRRDAAAAGVSMGVVDAYRSYEDQVRIAGELGLYSNGGKAAVPGTSEHGWGRALDLELGDQGVAWMRANAWKYGFVETVPGEPWHWEFHPAGP